jgi:hypothetical protein
MPAPRQGCAGIISYIINSACVGLRTQAESEWSFANAKAVSWIISTKLPAERKPITTGTESQNR